MHPIRWWLRKKSPANSDFFLFPTLDSFEIALKIKIVGKSKGSLLQRVSRAAKPRDIRPYDMRVRRDHGGGLWTIESNSGQLYLAVLSRESDDAVRRLDEARAAHGRRSYVSSG